MIVGGSARTSVVHPDLGVLVRHLGPHHLRPRVGDRQDGGLVLLLGDRRRLEQLGAPPVLGLGVGEPGLGDLELGLGRG
jgi:hypothetical protein